MRILLLALAVCVAAVVIGIRAEAQNYPWCAYYGMGDDGGGTNCGFVSFEQCMETLRGLGGFCNRNTQYHHPRRHISQVERAVIFERLFARPSQVRQFGNIRGNAASLITRQ